MQDIGKAIAIGSRTGACACICATGQPAEASMTVRWGMSVPAPSAALPIGLPEAPGLGESGPGLRGKPDTPGGLTLAGLGERDPGLRGKPDTPGGLTLAGLGESGPGLRGKPDTPGGLTLAGFGLRGVPGLVALPSTTAVDVLHKHHIACSAHLLLELHLISLLCIAPTCPACSSGYGIYSRCSCGEGTNTRTG